MCKIKLDGWKCCRCGHKWVPKKKGKPQWCPECNSPYWDRPVVKKTVSKARKKVKP